MNTCAMFCRLRFRVLASWLAILAFAGLVFPIATAEAQTLFGNHLELEASAPSIRMEVSDGAFRQIAFDGPSGGFGIYVPEHFNPIFWISRLTNPGMLSVDTLGVGIGNISPAEAALHVHSDGSGLTNQNAIGAANVLVENSLNHDFQLRTMLEMRNNGGIRFDLTNLNSNRTWAFQTNNSDNFLINLLGSGGNEFSIRKTGIVTMGPGGVHNFFLDQNGNLTIKGTLNQSSDLHAKREFRGVDGQDVLAKLASVPITTWRYAKDARGVRHMGPTAQDFHAAFGLGANDTTISVTDASGVALASIKALDERCEFLQKQLDEKDTVIAELMEGMEQLSLRLSEVESRE